MNLYAIRSPNGFPRMHEIFGEDDISFLEGKGALAPGYA